MCHIGFGENFVGSVLLVTNRVYDFDRLTPKVWPTSTTLPSRSLPCGSYLLVRQWVGTQLEMDGEGLGALAVLHQPRRAVTARGP
jgi:hypothetical protein